MMNRFMLSLIHHPWRVLLLSAMVWVASLSGMQKLVPNNDVRLFFDPESENRQLFTAIETEYGTRDSLTFIIQFVEPGQLFSVPGLQLVYQLTEQSWQLPDVRRVQSLSNFQAVATDDHSLEVGDLVRNAENLSPQDVARIRHIAMAEPLLAHGLVSGAEDAALIDIAVRPSNMDGSAARELVRQARQLAQHFEEHYPDQVRISVFGTVAISEAFDSETQAALGTILPLALVIMFAFMRYVLGNWNGAILTLLLTVLTIVSTMGLGGYMGVELTPITAYAPIILMTVTIATTMHLLVSYQEHLATSDQVQALRLAYQDNLYPIMLANITTAMGFLSLNTSNSIPFQDLGNVVAVGVGYVLFYSFVLLPALLALIPARRKRSGVAGLEKILRSMHRFAVVNHLKISILSIAVILVTGGLALGNVFNDNIFDYFDDESEIGSAIMAAKESFPGYNTVEFNFPARNGVTDPAYLRHLESLKEWALAQEEVVYVNSLSDVIKRLNRDFNGGDKQYYLIPDDPNLIAQYLLMYGSSLPTGLDLSNVLTLDHSAALFVVRIKADSTQDILAFKGSIETWVAEHFPEEMRLIASGFEPTFAETSMHNSRGVISSSLWAVFLISASLIFAFKSLRIGLICLLMNVLPGIIGFGVWRVLNGDVGMSVAIVFAITIGIIVDDTIHFVSRFLSARRQHLLGLEEALWFALQKSGVAIVTTSLVLIINFGLIATADFFPMSSMGLVSMVVITAALGCDLLVLPALMLTWSSLREGSRRGVNVRAGV